MAHKYLFECYGILHSRFALEHRYFLAPAHAIHQEHTEASDIRYKITSNLTRKICAVSKSSLQDLAKKYVLPVLAEQNLKTIDTERRHGGHIVRLRSIFFPIFERVMFELVFEKELPEDLNRVLCASAENVRNDSSNVHSNVTEYFTRTLRSNTGDRSVERWSSS